MTAEIDEITTEPSVEFDAKHFDDLVTNAIGEPDEIANEEANEDVAAAILYYRSLDAGSRTTARRYLENDAKQKVLEGKFAEGRSILLLADRIKKPVTRKRVRSSTPTRKPRNRTGEVATHIAAIQLGYSLAMLDAHNDQTLDPDWQDRIAEHATAEAQERAAQYALWLKGGQKGEEPEISEVEKAAARISLGRAPKGAGRKPATAGTRAPEPEPEPEHVDPVAAVVDDALAAFAPEL